MTAKKEYNESNTLVPLYDNEDVVCGIVYNGTPYYFLKNLQGDIIAITDANATVVARYTYDAWGVPTITQDTTTIGIATLNPYRYRGYYYDAEIGMYYLQSRYYDPIVGRFVNGDMIEIAVMCSSSLKSNVYCYCENSVINREDPFGYYDMGISAVAGVFITVGLFCVLLSIVCSPSFQRSWNAACEGLLWDFGRALNELDAFLNNLKAQLKALLEEIALAIGKSFAKVKTIPQYPSTREKHHIVAKKSYKAIEARTIINKVGIGYESPKNLIWIKTGLHRRIHTNLYYAFANSLIVNAYNLTEGNKKRSRKL